MFCSNCGSKLPEGARFCSTCGTRVMEAFTVPEVEEKPVNTGFVKVPNAEADKPFEAPLKKRVTFDWSNVIDEPQKKVVPDIKSPWTTTGSFDEKALYADTDRKTERSRTMSFIDVLKAEKEELAKDNTQAAEPVKPAEKPIEYTEVLDPGYLAGDILEEKKPEEKAPVLHFAPLYEDLDKPVVTPFDQPEKKYAPASEISIQATEPEAPAEAPAAEEPAAAPVQTEEIHIPDEAPAAVSEEPAAAVPEPTTEFSIPVEIIAPAEEPVIEEATEEAVEEPAAPEDVTEEPARKFGGWFDLPDFLKPKTKPAEEVIASAEEPAVEEVAEEVVEEVTEEPVEEVAEEPAEEAAVEEPVFEEPVFEDVEDAAEPEAEVSEEPSADAEYEDDLLSTTEDEYLNIDTERNPEFSRATMSFEMPDEDEEDEEDEADEEEETAEEVAVEEPEAEEPVDEEELFTEMEEAAPAHTGMTIAAPADKESEIEALKKRLAELMGTSWEEPAPSPAAEPEEPEVEEVAEEVVEEAAPEEPAVEEAAEEVIEEPAAEEPSYEEYLEPAEETVIPVAEPEAVVEEPAAEPEFNIEDAYLGLDEETPAPEVVAEEPELVFEAPEVVAEEPELVFEEPEVVAEEPELVFEEPEVVAEEPELVFEEPEVVAEEPELVFGEPEVVAEEPELVFEEPEVVAEEPELVFEAPEVVAQEPEVPEETASEEPAAEEEPVKTIDDFLAAILAEGAAEAPAHVAEEPAFTAPEPEAVSFEPEAVSFEPEAVEEPDLIITEPEEVPEEPAFPEEEPAFVPAAAEEEVTEKSDDVEQILSVEDLGIEIPTFTETAEQEKPEEEPAPEKKETDALSLEELEQDLFGAAAASTTEAEATKKIDKFYTLYRKNEEFQRLLDEEYSKLKAAGGPAPEPAIPEPEEPVPAKKIEDATIYQDFDLEKEAAKLREEQAKAAAEASGEAESAKSGAVSAAVPAAAAAAATGAAILTADKPEEEIVEVEKGGGFLTVLAVIIAILLIVLLGIILVLNFMPDSALAFKIDSVIENITSHFTAVDVMGKQLLL